MLGLDGTEAASAFGECPYSGIKKQTCNIYRLSCNSGSQPNTNASNLVSDVSIIKDFPVGMSSR